MMKNSNLIPATLSLLVLCGCNKGTETGQVSHSYEEFSTVKTSSIEPGGWILRFLEYQRDGLTGHIEAAGHPFNTGMWTGRIPLDATTQEQLDRSLESDGGHPGADEGVFWWPYEQTGYYIDGAMKCGYLLGDSMLLERARHQVCHLLQHPRENGRLGPAKLIGRWFNWPYAGLFRAFMTEYAETGDGRIVDAMHRHYLTFTPEEFQDELDVCNVEELCWLFGLTGDSSLLEMAEKAYALFQSNRENRNRDGRDIRFASDRIPDYHGVVYLEIVKIPAMLYAVTGKQEYLEEALNGIGKMEQHHMLASGLPSTTEHFNGISETAAHESCNLATLPYTYGTLLRVTGDPDWADRIEKAVFNAGMGAVTKDFKAHQYFSAPNQMIATTHTHHLGYYPAFMAYCPGHRVACCTGNINRMMPYYAMQMWMKTRNNGIAAVLLGPSEITTTAGENDIAVTIRQKTGYPFDETIEFEFEMEVSASFEFRVRIPAWCSDPVLTVNGRKPANGPVPGSYCSLERRFSDGDRITLTLPMEPRLVEWPNSGISFERGPIVYSLPIEDSAIVARNYEKSTGDFPAWDLYPVSEWAFSPRVSGTGDIKVTENNQVLYPWDADAPPVTLSLPAVPLDNWHLEPVVDEKTGLTHYYISGFPENPEFSGSMETIQLTPYGCTRLRVTVFPVEQMNE